VPVFLLIFIHTFNIPALSSFEHRLPLNFIPQVSARQASIWALVAFVFTLFFSYSMPGFPVTLAGLLVVIFLSVFVKETSATIIATVVSIIITLVLYRHHGNSFSNYGFIIFLLLLTSTIVLYTRKLNDQLNFEKSHMTALFENATEGILLTNHAGVIIIANPAAEKMFGYASGELMNQPVELLMPAHKAARHQPLRQQFYNQPEHRAMGSGKELYGQRKTGEAFHLDISLSYYLKGDQRFVIAFIVDITHRKQIEQSMQQQQQELEKVTREIKELNAALERKVEERTVVLKRALIKLESSQQELSEALDKERELNEIKSRFVSMASHEFRTPLSSVLSSASLLAKYTGMNDQEKRDKHIMRIKGAVKHLNDILEDFLSLGKLNEGKVTTSNTVFELTGFIEETNEDIKGLLKEGQQIWCVHTGSREINTDKNLLKNVLLNLISNAIKFSEPGTNIYINSEITGGMANISVRDEGMGISGEDQGHLFSSFFRGANVINIQGSGLGLHIVKRYLDLMNGTITLKSNINEGTTFAISIPTNY